MNVGENTYSTPMRCFSAKAIIHVSSSGVSFEVQSSTLYSYNSVDTCINNHINVHLNGTFIKIE